MNQKKLERRPPILGIIGGLSWVSTQQYYRLINERVNHIGTRQRSAELLVRSVNFQPIVDAQVRNDWAAAGTQLSQAAASLEQGGAGAFLIASNTMHLVYEQVCAAVSIPGLNIFDCTAKSIHSGGCKRVALLGTRYTMGLPFYREEYARRGLDVVIPGKEDAAQINEIIFKELIRNIIRPESILLLGEVINRLVQVGAQGVILGCTELELLVNPQTRLSLPIQVFDTTAIHCQMAVDWLTSSQNPEGH